MSGHEPSDGAPAELAPLKIDRAYLATNHPDLLATLIAEGATAERERIKAVRDQSIPGHEALIETLAADGKTTGPEAAVAVLRAEKALRESAQASIANAPAPTGAAHAFDADEKAAKAKAAQAARDQIMAQVTGGAK